MLCMGVKALHAVTERRQRAKAGRSADFFARTHSHLHLFKLMLKMIQHDDGRSETKTTFKTRYWWYAGSFISHARTHPNLHIVRLMLKMNCSKRPKRSKKNAFKTRYRWYAGTFNSSWKRTCRLEHRPSSGAAIDSSGGAQP